LLNAPRDVLRVIDEEWREEFNITDYTNEKEQLLKIHEKCKNIKYVMNSSGWGRVMPYRSISIGLVRRKLRHTLCDGMYIDVDIENAHPEILFQAMKSNGVECPHLERYVNERADILKEVIEHYGLIDEEDKTTRDKSKNLFIRLMYLGSLDKWGKDNKCSKMSHYPYALEFQNEMNMISGVIMEANPELVKYCKKKAYNDKQRGGSVAKLESSVMSIWCQEIERRCLEEMVMVIPERLREYLVLCYDGMMIPEEIFEEILPYTMMKRIEKKLGLMLKITKKDMNDNYDVSQYEPANMWYEAVKEKIEREDGLCWVRDVKSYFFRDSTDVVAPFTEAQLKAEYRVQPCDFLKTWQDDFNRKTYDRVDYIIDKNLCPERVLNLREPMAFDNFSGKKTNIPYDLIQKHIDLLTGGNLLIFEDFLAYRVRNPDTLVPIAFLIKAIQGVGKSRLFEDICKFWFNKNCYNEAQNMEQAGLGSFNGVLQGKMFSVWAEVNGKTGYSQEDALKNLITNPNLLIHKKGREMYHVSNKINWVVVTNNEVSIKITDEDRRWYVFSASPELKSIKTREGREYFQNLSSQSDNPLSWESYYYYLKNEHTFNHEINRPEDFQAYIPQTVP
jgi:hypothetical protein